MNFASRLWRKSVFLFDPAQHFFNGNFWEEFKQKFGYFTKGSIVDLGCGTGDLLNHINPDKYTGVDINASYINSNRSKWGGHTISFVFGDITKYKPQAGVDTAFLISVVHHLNDLQISNLCSSISKSQVKTFIVIDGYPIGIFSNTLAWLDKILGGGEHFRKEEEIRDLVGGFFKIVESGTFDANNSFYRYPYLIAILNES